MNKKRFPEKDEGAKNTLFWEFGKMIAKLAGQDNNLVYITQAVRMVANSLKDLDSVSLISKVK